MGYLLYSSVFILLILSTGTSPPLPLPSNQPKKLTSTLTTVLFLTRTTWLPHLPHLPTLPFTIPGASYLYTRLPSTFTSDIEAGLTSTSFDLAANNVNSGDSRAGLDDAGKREVQRIMKKRRVGFDEARRIYVQDRLEREGIAPDGRPRDPKFVSFS